MKKNPDTKNGDLKDSARDIAAMANPATTVIDMPEVKDIPGQEHVKPPQFGEMQDVTIASADEEGEGITDDLNEEQDIANDLSNVSSAEKKLLKKAAGHPATEETTDIDKMVLDESDEDGDLLNEKSLRTDRYGNDLDIPGTEADDDDEALGEEDEENNAYSQPD